MFKRIGLLFITVMLVVSAVGAQLTPTKFALATTTTYEADQVDTSKALRLASANLISSWFAAADSAVVYRVIQYSRNNSTWTTVSTDTITLTAAGSSEKVVRTATVDLLAGVAGYMRTILTFATAGNGVTSPTYDNWVYARP